MTNSHKSLERLRKKAGLTQRQVAKNIGITEGFYNSLECGRLPVSLKRAKILANHYGVTINDILNEDTTTPTARMLPLLGTTQAGNWRTIVPNWEGETLPAVGISGSPNAFYLRVDGESMAPQIQHGDYVIIDPDQQVGNNDIGLFVFQDETTIKRLQKDAGISYLVPDNDRFDTQKANAETYDIGKVIRIMRMRDVF